MDDGGNLPDSTIAPLRALRLFAELTRRLAERGIAANVVAGRCHDHVFVPSDRRAEALDAINRG